MSQNDLKNNRAATEIPVVRNLFSNIILKKHRFTNKQPGATDIFLVRMRNNCSA